MLSVNKCRVKPKVVDSLQNKKGLAQVCFWLATNMLSVNKCRVKPKVVDSLRKGLHKSVSG
jgi:hypothetical protein